MQRTIRNLFGWSSQKKIIVLESDDWGAERISLDAKTYYKNKGYDISSNWMSNLDTLESEKDLYALEEVLQNSIPQKPLPITLLMNTAIPDYDKIKASDYTIYYYKGLNDYNSKSVLDIYRSWSQNGLAEFGFHGREHLAVNRWLKDLQKGVKHTLEGFNHETWGFSKAYISDYNTNYRAAFALDDIEVDLNFQKNAILDGVKLQTELLGVKPRYFVAPDGSFSLSLVDSLKNAGIDYIGMPRKFVDEETKNNFYFWLGRKYKKKITVVTRNCLFEPASPRETDWIDRCLSDINNAFILYKPAIISSHRANYVGGLDKENRSIGLKALNSLIIAINKKWPNVYFLTSSQLGDYITRNVCIDEIIERNNLIFKG